MRSILTSIIATAALLTFISGHAKADYYTDEHKPGTEGFWWYKDEPVKKKKEKKEEKEKPKQRRVPSFSDYTKKELWNMHPDDFLAFSEEIKKKAVQYPTEQNVKDYYELQEIARKKSLEFTNVAGYIWQKYPELSTAKDQPVVAPGINALTRQGVAERNRVISSAQNDFALVYFYTPGCQFCIEQSGILKFFTDQYHWQIKGINIEDNPQLASRFNVNTTPMLILVQRGNQDYLPVSAGVASMTEIEEKLYKGIRLMRGEIRPEEYNLYDFQRGGGYDTSIR